MTNQTYVEPYSEEWEESIEEMLNTMETQYKESFFNDKERIEFERSANL